jgi:hypothetical protein
MITEKELHDILHENLDGPMRDMINDTLARASYNVGPLPPNDRIAAVIKRVLEAFATLPGEYWLPNDEADDDKLPR